MLTEIKQRLFREPWIVRRDPTPEFYRYVDDIKNGRNPLVNTGGYGRQGILDYYGIDLDSTEKARLRIPWGPGQQLEQSIHISRSGTNFRLKFEGFFPHDGK